MNPTTATPSTATTSVSATPRTIAQGLRRVKQLKCSVKEHESRATQSVSYEAGKPPKFSFKAEREARAKAQDDLVRLESAIAVANATTRIEAEGRRMTLAEAIRRLQELKANIVFVTGLQLTDGTREEASRDWDDTLGREIRRTRQVTHTTDLSVTDRVAEIEALRARFESLNDVVEAANHRTPIEVEAG